MVMLAGTGRLVGKGERGGGKGESRTGEKGEVLKLDILFHVNTAVFDETSQFSYNVP